jgi:hypothetical protein
VDKRAGRSQHRTRDDLQHTPSPVKWRGACTGADIRYRVARRKVCVANRATACIEVPQKECCPHGELSENTGEGVRTGRGAAAMRVRPRGSHGIPESRASAIAWCSLHNQRGDGFQRPVGRAALTSRARGANGVQRRPRCPSQPGRGADPGRHVESGCGVAAVAGDGWTGQR